MNASELSIGNLVYVNDHTGESGKPVAGEAFLVVAINHFSVDLMLPDADLTRTNAVAERISDLSPIPIRSDWLLKLGFTVHGSTWKSDRFELSETDSGFALSSGGISFGHTFKYVHQLQNIYVALHGQA